MRGLLALSALAATVWVPTTGATLIVEHETWGPYVWDRYTSVERSHITVSYTDGVWVYTEPPFVHWFWSVSENGEGSLHNAVTFPAIETGATSSKSTYIRRANRVKVKR